MKEGDRHEEEGIEKTVETASRVRSLAVKG
jgi:hypothetical protein